MTRNIIYDERRNKALVEIKAAQDSRNKKVEPLEAVRLALKKLRGEDPSLEQVKSLLNTRDDKDLCSVIFAIWHTAMNINVPFGMLNVHSTEHMTDDQRAVYDAVKAIEYDKKSSDPARYWDKKQKKFVPLPLTDEEKELIFERNKLYIKSQEEGKVYEFVKMFTELFNRSAMNHQVKITPATFHDLLPWLDPYVLIKGKKPNAKQPFGYQKEVVFVLEIKEDLFFYNDKKRELVFDE
jgi:hypothetical protein